MLASLREPIGLLRLALLSVGTAALVALYCIIYTALTGRAESVGQALAWALANILPWIPALEGAKRARNWRGAAISLLAGLAASLAIGALLAGSRFDLALEAWRRVPAMAAVGSLAIALRWGAPLGARKEPDVLPLLPRQIDWVRAARNYVELRSNGRAVVHRTSLSAVERELADHGFVRIHRSILVRRDRIARVRPDDVVLADGTHLKVGKSYRAQLGA